MALARTIQVHGYITDDHGLGTAPSNTDMPAPYGSFTNGTDSSSVKHLGDRPQPHVAALSDVVDCLETQQQATQLGNILSIDPVQFTGGSCSAMATACQAAWRLACVGCLTTISPAEVLF